MTTEGLFVLQCGDPDGDGTGGPGYSYGPVENAPEDGLYPAGTIAMARQSGNGYSQGSQFFVVYEDTTLPADAAGGYTVIGQVTSGLDALVADVVAKGTADGSADGAPAEPVAITSVSLQ
ncbi:peptidylprolyl isomerase [Rathayibacter sp. VKM Ac-2630]|uniref:peptidylprolyl isomerase n=1 Tax=Rathayibacter sp. VKM Ac-2630 TaxID=1938617 RepID=UPI003158C7DF